MSEADDEDEEDKKDKKNDDDEEDGKVCVYVRVKRLSPRGRDQ